MYIAWMTFGDSFKDVSFPDLPNWNMGIVLGQKETGWNQDVYMDARGLDGRVYITPKKPLIWSDGRGKEREVRDNMLLTVAHSVSREKIKILIRKCDHAWSVFEKYTVPRRRIIIGHGETADIRDKNVLISQEHGFLGLTQEGYFKYQDNSKNGTYVNGKQIVGISVRLNLGDVLAYSSGLKLVFLGDCIAVNVTPSRSRVTLERWRPRAVAKAEDEREMPSVYTEFQRAPRMLKKSSAENTEIEAPLTKQEQNQPPVFLQLGPSMTMVLPMFMGQLVANGLANGLSSGIVMISTSAALAVMWGLINRRYREKAERAGEERRTQLYRQYIQETELMLREMNARERQRLVDTFPDIAQCAAMPGKVAQNLWDRMPLHPDFLHVRIGRGEVAMPCEISIPKQKLSLIDDELRNEPLRIKETYSIIREAPMTIALQGEPVIGLLGKTRAMLFMQGLLMQIAALHSYHDVRIAVLTEEDNASFWAWTRWLPHVFSNEDRELRMVAYKPEDIHDVVAHLDEVLSRRKNFKAEQSEQDAEEDGKGKFPLPHYVIFCTNYRILEEQPIMRQLLTNRHGMTLVMLGESMAQLPKECRIVLNMRGEKGLMHSSGGDTSQVEFEYPNQSLVESFAKGIAPLRVHDVTQNAAIPTMVSFLDIYDVRSVEELDVWRMWMENHTYEGLKSVIGHRAGSRPFVLDISDKYHGPHGLIAGTTGSGKSVMLETYILSLALNYSPKQVRFILIDYKGGGMADSFRNLPHVAGIIDNLQGERVIDRALASLNGEIHRREKIFKEAKINNINDYAREYGEIPGRELPHLIIIADEFAELKSEQPAFMGELVSASRVGRSLGIHLILATQKPSNSVSDEIWANSRFHLCLRVQTRQDSMEMLKRPDAAYIRGSGRCFIQIGNDELFEEVQTSYSGCDYRPNEPRAEEMPQLINGIGHVVRAPARRKREGEKYPSQMTAVLERVCQVAAEHGMLANHQMWLPEMPSRIYLQDMEIFQQAAWNGESYLNPPGNLVIPMGLADDVAHQRYLPFSVDLTQMRNLLIVGLAGTGKTTLVQSMVYSLCSIYDAAHLNIYIFSLTSQTLGNLSAFPQVGDIVFDEELIELKRFINMLWEEMNRRAELFASAATDSFVEYNAACLKRGQAPEPATVIFVDRYLQLRAMFENDDFYTARIQTLLQEGSGRGIHFVVTAMGGNELQGKLHPFFGGVALQLKERSDYQECLGKRIPYDMPAISTCMGRGMGVLGGNVYEVQFALGGSRCAAVNREAFTGFGDVERYAVTRSLPKGDEQVTDVDRAAMIVDFAGQLHTCWTGPRPKRIPRIPKDPTWETLFGDPAFAKLQETDFLYPIGYDMVQGALAPLDIDGASAWLVHGPQRSGVTNFLKLMARVAAQRKADVHILGDAHWIRLARELNLPLYETPEAIVKFLQDFIQQYAKPRKALRDAAMQEGRAAARKQAAAFKPCVILIDNAQRLHETFSQEAHRQHLPLVQGLLGEIAEKQYYNLAVFMGLSSKERLSAANDPIKRVCEQGHAVALGGKLSEFDPCGIASTLPAKVRSSTLAAGQGFLGNNGTAVQIVVPLAEWDE